MNGTRSCTIQTFTGKPFSFDQPAWNIIDPVDIAHALSNICRFTGNCKKFYSVAEHCVRVSDMLPDHLALQGLLHDALEAYTGDISTPMKNALDVLTNGGFRIWETMLECDIRTKLGLPTKFDPMVKQCDLMDYGAALRDIMSDSQFKHDYTPPVTTRIIGGWSPDDAKAQFISRWVNLDPKVAQCF